MTFGLKRRNGNEAVGILGAIILVVVVIVVLAYFGFVGLHL